MSEKPRLVIRKWVKRTFTGQLDSIERRVLEAIFMNIKSLRAVKYVTLNTTDMFKAGLHMSFKDLRLADDLGAFRRNSAASGNDGRLPRISVGTHRRRKRGNPRLPQPAPACETAALC